MNLSFSLVIFHPDIAVLSKTLSSLGDALQAAREKWPELNVKGYVIDNEEGGTSIEQLQEVLSTLRGQNNGIQILGNGKNLGYGGGHNLCLPLLQGFPSDYHLIINPDVFLQRDFFIKALSFLEEHKEVVVLAPHASCDSGQPLYLCKRYPSVLDLALRGFAPQFIRKFFSSRLDRYQMRDLYESGAVSTEVPIISGCCMLVRTEVLQALKGFNERYFLYFEDFDLSLRLAEKGKVAYHPEVLIQHLGGFSAKKGWWHIQQFIRSGKLFFSQHGWRWW